MADDEITGPSPIQRIEDLVSALEARKQIPLPGKTKAEDVAALNARVDELVEQLMQRDQLPLPVQVGDLEPMKDVEDEGEEEDEFVDRFRTPDLPLKTDGIEGTDMPGGKAVTSRDEDFESDAVTDDRRSLDYVYHTDLMSDAPPPMAWSNGSAVPVVFSYKDFFVMQASKTLFWFWIPVREGWVHRLEVTMENVLAAGPTIQFYPIFRMAGSPCPDETIYPTVITTGQNVATVPPAYLGDFEREGNEDGKPKFVKRSNGYVIYWVSGSSHWRCGDTTGATAYFHTAGTNPIEVGWADVGIAGVPTMNSGETPWGSATAGINTGQSDLFGPKLEDDELLGVRVECIDATNWGFGTSVAKHPLVTAVIEYEPAEV